MVFALLHGGWRAVRDVEMACSLLASGAARLVTKPMYLELAALLPVPPAPAAALPDAAPDTISHR